MSAPAGREPDLIRAFERAGQGHVLHHLPRLAAPEREQFLDQLAQIDLALLEVLRREALRDQPVATLDLRRLEPAPALCLPATPGARRKESRARAAGAERLRAGKVAALVVAGGQGSRLGFAGPKGCLPIGPVSGCSLFEWHVKKVLAARRRFGAPIPLLIMTSATNAAATREFLAQHDWFGMAPEDVLLFQQGMLPAIDPAGRLLLAGRSSLFVSPDGHGGTLLALRREGMLDELERRGVEELFTFQVDNPLVKVLDAAYIGHHHLARAEISSKVVAKRDAEERVGVFARAGRKLGIVEYSDLPRELMEAREPGGGLRFWAGNIAIHVLSTSFVRRLTEGGLKLPYHRARKKVRCLAPPQPGAEAPAPALELEAIKFETFLFDAIPLAKRALVVETARAEEFSPVKNRTGEDSAETARRDLSRLFARWLAAAGFAGIAPEAALEISPLFSLDEEEFVTRVRKERRLPLDRLLFS